MSESRTLLKNRRLPTHISPILSANLHVLLLGLLFGSSLVVSRFSVGQFQPRDYVALRLVIAALLHVSAYPLWSRRPWPRDLSLWLRAGLLGLLGSALPMTAIVSSLQYQSSGVSGLLLTLNPVVVVLLAHWFLHDEPLTWNRMAGALVAFAGAGLLLMRGESGLAEFARADWRGYAWIGVGVMASASSSVYARRFLRWDDAFDVATIRMVAAALATLGVVGMSGGFRLGQVGPSGAAALAYGSVMGTFLAFLVSFRIIKRFGATPVAQTSYVIPVVSTILGVLFLDERVTGAMLVGMGVIFAGIALLNRRPKRAEPGPGAGLSVDPGQRASGPEG